MGNSKSSKRKNESSLTHNLRPNSPNIDETGSPQIEENVYLSDIDLG